MTHILSLLLGLMVASLACAQEARPLVTLDTAAPNLIRPDAWTVFGDAQPEISAGILTTDNGPAAKSPAGYVQTIELNQSRAAAVVARASSRAISVSGQSDSDYSLYLDILYQDGTPLWGQNEPFKTGNADWNTVEVKVLPAKPIKRISFYLLMRNHSGKAQFKDISLREASAMADLCWLDGQLIKPVAIESPATLFRDVAANTGYISSTNAARYGLQFQLSREAGQTQITVTDTTGNDRAITILYTSPIEQGDWQWWSSISESTKTDAGHEYVSGTRQRAGSGTLSRWPLVAVSAGHAGRALAINLRQPVFYRLGYAAGTRELYLAADIALTREKPSATFACRELPFTGEQGMRGALTQYQKAFPDVFAVRVKKQGLWMPFFPISKVESWQDFGFAFKEGADEPSWDDQHDVLTFRYTEPMTWWMALPKGTPRTMEAAIAHAQQLATRGDRDAAAWLTSSFRDADGNIPGRIRNEPWCDGIVWSMNSAPGIPNGHFQTKWNDAIRKNPGGKTPGHIDGEYIDSVEGYVTDDLDYRREHFAAMKSPLVFSPTTHKPAIYKGLIAYEYVNQIAADCHADGKYSMANGTPGNWPWIPPMIDVMGTETNWKQNGKWMPMSIDDMQYRRALAGGKPYCYLMNTDFDQFSNADVERYMKRCLAFAFFPGMFSHNASEKQYFSQPALYNRDRDLFKKYVPVIRAFSEAGWRPAPSATGSDPAILIEQFGDRYFTAFNPGKESRTFTLKLPGNAVDALTREPLKPELTLQAEDVLAIEVQP